MEAEAIGVETEAVEKSPLPHLSLYVSILVSNMCNNNLNHFKTIMKHNIKDQDYGQITN